MPIDLSSGFSPNLYLWFGDPTLAPPPIPPPPTPPTPRLPPIRIPDPCTPLVLGEFPETPCIEQDCCSDTNSNAYNPPDPCDEFTAHCGFWIVVKSNFVNLIRYDRPAHAMWLASGLVNHPDFVNDQRCLDTSRPIEDMPPLEGITTEPPNPCITGDTIRCRDCSPIERFFREHVAPILLYSVTYGRAFQIANSVTKRNENCRINLTAISSIGEC